MCGGVAMPTVLNNVKTLHCLSLLLLMTASARTPLVLSGGHQKLGLTDSNVCCSADECLKAHCVNQLEALQSLQEEYATLWEHYQQLHVKSREIIATLQEERDQKIAECENLSLQMLEVQHKEFKGVEKNNTDANLSELETVRGEYNKLVCSYTRLKLEYESVLASHQQQLEDMKKEQDLEVSSLLEKLKLTQHEEDTVYNVHHIRRLQKLNSEFEQKIDVVTQELEKAQSEHRAKLSEKEQVILEQSECLRNAQSQIKALEVKCSTLTQSLESTQEELAQGLEKQMTLRAAVEQARRESSRIREGIEEERAKQKVQRSSAELQLSQEYQKLKDSYDVILNEKKEYNSQLELLNETVKDYEALLANKEVELDAQLQVLRHSEWQKRVALERENTVLQEKLAAHEREMRILEEKSESQQTKLQDHAQELSTKCMALEAEITSFKAEQQQQNECSKITEMELQILMEKNYKKKHQSLQSQYKRLLETNQKLENDCTKLQSTVCTLELAVSDADKEVAHLTELHQQTLDIERKILQDENAELLHRLNEEEMQVKTLLNDLENERKHSKKVCRHYKKKVVDTKESLELAKAKQVQVEEEKESIRKSLSLDTAKLKNEICKLKRRENEFKILLQGDYGMAPGYSMSNQEDGVPSLVNEHSQPVIAHLPST